MKVERHVRNWVGQKSCSQVPDNCVHVRYWLLIQSVTEQLLQTFTACVCGGGGGGSKGENFPGVRFMSHIF
jgi:hypothetical protein